MRIGAWSNFDELEDSLTLDELIELYESQMDAELRLMKTLGRFMGVEFGAETSEVEEESAFDRVRKNALKRIGKDPEEVDMNNLGMDYKRI